MEGKVDRVAQLLQANMKLDRQLERLDDLITLTGKIHENRVNNARSSEIAPANVKYVEEGRYGRLGKDGQ